MTIRKRILRSLRNQKGETLLELLFSLLISSLAMLILASMIVASTNIIKRGNVVLGDYISAENEMVKNTSTPETEAEAAFIKTNGSIAAQKLTDYDPDSQVSVNYYTNNKLGGKLVISYEK